MKFTNQLLTRIFAMLLWAAAPAFADTPSTHGMLLFGDKTNYASHLPMFHSPHDYQAIFKIELKDLEESNTLNDYKKSKESGEKIHTIVPEPMDLSEVLIGSKKKFIASIFIGHFERGGINIGKIKIRVERIIFQDKLIANKENSKENYLIFGESGEYYATHIIGAKPSFDAVYAVSPPKIRIVDPLCSPGTRMSCVKVKQLPDSELPVELAPMVQDEQMVNVGELLGNPFSTSAIVLELIYSEQQDLSF